MNDSKCKAKHSFIFLNPRVSHLHIATLVLENKFSSHFNLFHQVFDILWSDPQPAEGCIPNALRGAGTYFGPDVTRRFLKRNKMMYIVRSHECKPEGYELNHNNKVKKVCWYI